MTEAERAAFTVVARYPEDGLKIGNFETRDDAEESKETALGFDAVQAAIFPPGEVPDPKKPFAQKLSYNTENMAEVVDESVPEQSPDVVPGDMGIDKDPLDVLPGWMKTQVSYNDRADSKTTINKRGCQVVAEYLGLEPSITAVERAKDTDFEYATYEATVTKPDGRTFMGTGTAVANEADQGEDAGWKLDMMAETRAYKRAVKAATAGGLEAFAKEQGGKA